MKTSKIIFSIIFVSVVLQSKLFYLTNVFLVKLNLKFLNFPTLFLQQKSQKKYYELE